jgi:Integrase core domain
LWPESTESIQVPSTSALVGALGLAYASGQLSCQRDHNPFNKAFSTQGIPHYLSSDNDPLFRYYRWQANLRILDVTEIKSVPYVPLSHPFVERLIGTIRREYLDHALFWNAGDLERKLEEYRHYYVARRQYTGRNQRRIHHSPR